MDVGWIVMISSKQPTSEEPFPNIYYEISEDGQILKRENMRIAE